MISYEEALEIAKQHKEQIDNCTEYENAYIFGYSGDNMFIGGDDHAPIVVMKEDGRVTNMLEFDSDGEEIRTFDVKG